MTKPTRMNSLFLTLRSPRRLVLALVEHARPLRLVLLVLMGLLVVTDFLVPNPYQRFPWDAIGGFGALYGFLSCVVIIVVSKAYGYLIAYRPEDYYEASTPLAPPAPVSSPSVAVSDPSPVLTETPQTSAPAVTAPSPSPSVPASPRKSA